MHNAVGEELLYISRLRVRERNESLFRSAQIEGRIVTAHRLLKTLHIAVDIPIEKFEKEAEILRVALMRGCGHQKEVIGHGRQGLAEAVRKSLFVRAIRRHLVRLIHDDQIPSA